MGLPIMDGIRGYIVNGLTICATCGQSDDFEAASTDAITSLMRSESIWTTQPDLCSLCGQDVAKTNIDLDEDQGALWAEWKKLKKRYSD